MEEIKQQAFPHLGYDGMTLRDYFAAKAMQAMVDAIYSRNEVADPETLLERFNLIPVNSYHFADAMLKQREL